MRRQSRNRTTPSPAAGFALPLVMVVLAILGIAALALLSSATESWSDTQVARSVLEARTDASAGLEQARGVIVHNERDLITEWQLAAAGGDRCQNEWIGHGVNAVASPVPPSSTINRARSGDYTVDFCAASCNQGSAGNDMGSGSTGRYYTVTVASDLVANPTTSTGRPGRTQAGLMLADVVTQSPCR